MKNINFTDNGDRKDLLIINQHGGSPDFKFPPVIQEEMDSLGESLRNFLEVERDTGATEITAAVFRRLSDSGLRVAKVEVPFPRAVCDINRRPHLASSIPFSGAALAEIERIHRPTTQEILDVISKTDPFLILDQHTMAPSAPAENPDLSMDDTWSFGAHVDVWNSASRTGDPRSSCIIDSTSDGKKIGNRLFGTFLESNLRVSGFPQPEFNKPFAPNPERHQGQLFIGNGRGIALDIPKHELTDTPRSEIDLSCLKISRARVEVIAELIADSVHKTLRSIKR